MRNGSWAELDTSMILRFVSVIMSETLLERVREAKRRSRKFFFLSLGFALLSLICLSWLRGRAEGMSGTVVLPWLVGILAVGIVIARIGVRWRLAPVRGARCSGCQIEVARALSFEGIGRFGIDVQFCPVCGKPL
jgi:hypothetical protein